MDVNKMIEEIKCVSEFKTSGHTEENIKIHVVLELLKIFGHKEQSHFEHSYGTDRVDICIKKYENPIIIEVKGAKEDLNQHINQIKRYSYEYDAIISILTNGSQFLIYSPLWKRIDFNHRMILNFKLTDLDNENIIEKLLLLLNSSLTFSQIKDNIVLLEKEIEANEVILKENILSKEILEKDKSEIELLCPDIKEMAKFYDHLTPDVKFKIDNYKKICTDLLNLSKEIKVLESKQNRFINFNESNNSHKDVSIKQSNNNIKSLKTDFQMGIVNEIINIHYITTGKQLIICHSKIKSNDFVFLLPKATYDSKYTPSELGNDLIDKLRKSNFNPRETKHIAKLDYISIPGRNRQFWQELWDINEFNLWSIDNGPFLYFNNKNEKRKMLLWIIRAYELPFNLVEGNDIKRESQGNASINNADTLSKIQEAFKTQSCMAVISDEEFELRNRKIVDIANKYRNRY